MDNITVVNKYKHVPTSDDVYIGRGSPFGSPFSHLKSKYDDVTVCNTREEAIKLYKEYFNEEMLNPSKLNKAMHGLINKVCLGLPVNLVCFCKPKACHGDVIKEYIETNFKL